MRLVSLVACGCTKWHLFPEAVAFRVELPAKLQGFKQCETGSEDYENQAGSPEKQEKPWVFDEGSRQHERADKTLCCRDQDGADHGLSAQSLLGDDGARNLENELNEARS